MPVAFLRYERRGSMEKDNITVKVETFEENEEEQQKHLQYIQNWNNAMRGNGVCQPTYAEEMNLKGDPDFIWIGKGSLWG